MATRDVSRVRIQLPLQDTDGDGSTNVGSDVYLCITTGFNWSGITRSSVEETCSETTEDDWGNIWKIFRGGRVIDPGTLTVTVDWDVDDTNGGREFVALVNSLNGDIVVEFPAGDGETTGPTITLSGHCNSFTPNGSILGEEGEARLTAEFVWRISGRPTFAAAT